MAKVTRWKTDSTTNNSSGSDGRESKSAVILSTSNRILKLLCSVGIVYLLITSNIKLADLANCLRELVTNVTLRK
jgi:hypothetical protein